MRLFFDQNFYPRLKVRLVALYPDSIHISDVGLATADDLAVWANSKD
jgi:predicted nuclease of predicted toxin-antitoxin system